MKKLWFILSFILCVSSAFADQNYLAPFTSSVNIDDKSTGVHLGKAGYSIPVGDNFWSLRQWGNPSNLLPQAFPYGTSWSIANSNSRIKFYPSLNGVNNVYELAAANVPCATGQVTENNEFDMFLEPNQMPTAQQSLGTMGQLYLALDFAGTYANPQYGCSHNASGYVVSLILGTTTQPSQFLYVQIDLGGTQAPPSGLAWCPDYDFTTKPQYKNIFCVDDSVERFGGRYIYNIGSQSYHLDILPRLIQIIKSGHIKAGSVKDALHSNPNDWIIVGFYMGITNYGQTNVTTTWSNPVLSGEGGTFCAAGASKKTQFICGVSPIQPGWVNVGGGCYHRPSELSC